MAIRIGALAASAICLLLVSVEARAVSVLGYDTYVCRGVSPGTDCFFLLRPYQGDPLPPAILDESGGELPLTANASISGSAVTAPSLAQASIEGFPPGAVPRPPGVIRLYADLETPDDGSGDWLAAMASAYVEDDLVITVPGRPDGELLKLRGSVRVTGDIEIFASGVVEWDVTWARVLGGLGGEPAYDNRIAGGGICNGVTPPCSGVDVPPATFTGLLEFQNGRQFKHRWGAGAGVQGSYPTQGSADLGAVEWLGFELLDYFENPIPLAGVTLTSTSGIDWSLPSAVPEPRSAVLSSAALTCLVFLSTWKRLRRKPETPEL